MYDIIADENVIVWNELCMKVGELREGLCYVVISRYLVEYIKGSLVVKGSSFIFWQNKQSLNHVTIIVDGA